MTIFREAVFFMMIAFILIGCTGKSIETVSTPIQPDSELMTNSPVPDTATHESTQASGQPEYELPVTIDPQKQYLFYLHGRIIEDQGIPARSPEYGEYEYEAILKKLSSYEFVVISEQRPKNTDGIQYARKVVDEINTLLEAGVPPKNITIVGASKGAGIAVYVSHLLGSDAVNYVIMAICHPEVVADFKQNQVFLKGNVLSIYDVTDEYAGSCQELFSVSLGKGISSYDEVLLHVGTGHGILYKPLDEWVLPTVQWANKNAE